MGFVLSLAWIDSFLKTFFSKKIIKKYIRTAITETTNLKNFIYYFNLLN